MTADLSQQLSHYLGFKFGVAPEEIKFDLMVLADGRLEITVHHAPLDDIQPEQLMWWYERLFMEISFQGRRVTLAELWVPDWPHSLRLIRPGRENPMGYSAGAVVGVRQKLGWLEGFTYRIKQFTPQLLECHFYYGPFRVGILRHQISRQQGATQVVSHSVMGPRHTKWLARLPVVGRKLRVGPPEISLWVRYLADRVANLQYLIPLLQQNPQFFEASGPSAQPPKPDHPTPQPLLRAALS